MKEREFRKQDNRRKVFPMNEKILNNMVLVGWFVMAQMAIGVVILCTIAWLANVPPVNPSP